MNLLLSPGSEEDKKLMAHGHRFLGAGASIIGEVHVFLKHGHRLPEPPNPHPDRTVPAENFMATIAANVDNDKMDDAAFRDLIRNTLPIVQYPRKDDEQATLED